MTSVPPTPAPAGDAGRRQAAMPFIMITVLIDMMSIGLIVPVLPALVGTFTSSQSEQAWWYGAVTFAFSLANFFASPLLGALSDRYGRRPVLLLGFCGLAISFFGTALATAIWMLIVVRVLSGAMQANALVANAYVADITPPEDRARRFGLLGAMFGLGFILGPVVGGLLGAIDLRLPFFAAGSLALVNLLYGWFVLPESLSAASRRPFDWRAAFNPITALTELGRLGGVGRLVAVIALHGALAVHALHDLGSLRDLQVRLGSERERLVAVRGRRDVGAGAGRPARATAQAVLAAAPRDRRAGVVDARLHRLGRGERGLDDVRRHHLQRPRLHRRGIDAEHRLGRRRRDHPGPDDGRGERRCKA